MKILTKLKKASYFSAFSGWIENLGVVPLLLLRAFLLLPIFVFLLALLFLVTLVLETIFQLLSVSHSFFGINQMAHWATRCPRHNFINLEVLRPCHLLVKDILIPLTLIIQTHSVAAKSPSNFQELSVSKANGSSAEIQVKDITLAKGELIRVSLPQVSRYSIGNKEVLKVKSLPPKGLLLKGEKLGHSDLLIWKKGATSPVKLAVFVVRKSHQLKLMQISHTFSSLGIHATRRGELIELEGKVETLANYHELIAHLKNYKDLVYLEGVALSPLLKKKVFSHFLNEMGKHQLSEINCHPLRLFIRCEASKELREKLTSLGDNYLIEWVSEGLLEATKQYKISLVLQQFENSSGHAFNFGLSKVEGKLTSILLNNPLALIENNTVQFKKELFRSQTLAHPTIKGRLGFPIKVRIGQQIPFLQSVSNGVATQQWRFAGLSLDINLTAFSQRLKVKYKTNLSRPQGGGISENLQESMLLIPIGETMVLFDIGFRVNQKDLSKLPVLNNIPLFGSLFKGEAANKTYKKILCLIKIEEI